VIMAMGFATLPGIAMGLDDRDAAPGWIWIGFLGWIGTFIIYPVWRIWLGRVLLRGAVSDAAERRSLRRIATHLAHPWGRRVGVGG
jgi:hypothetical protein